MEPIWVLLGITLMVLLVLVAFAGPLLLLPNYLGLIIGLVLAAKVIEGVIAG